jgi:hypothetical protein
MANALSEDALTDRSEKGCSICVCKYVCVCILFVQLLFFSSSIPSASIPLSVNTKKKETKEEIEKNKKQRKTRKK